MVMRYRYIQVYMTNIFPVQHIQLRVPIAVAAMLLITLWFAAAAPVAAADVTVFAAASLKVALDEQARQFDAGTGNRTRIAYAGSNALARQIEAGAPADLFISADLDWMDYLEQRRLLRPGSRINLLTNALVLIAPAASKATLAVGPNFPLAAALNGGRLAMANPDSVPAGKYAKDALQKLGVWPTVQKRLAPGENVRAALAFVARGEVPLGIVYKTDALADKGVRIVDHFPADSHPPIVYPAAIVASSVSPAAQSFLDYLRTGGAAQIWEKHGFGVTH
jgi:molybdate transport system substrate-binding protein